jgi:rhodanese-related sulfurtransferase
MLNMKNYKYIVLLTLLPFVITGCYHADDTIYGSTDNMVMAASAEVNFMNVEQLNAMFDAQATALRIVDVREPEEFEAGHIPGAVNVPRGVLEFSGQMTNRRERVVLYSNHHNRSSLSSGNLKLMKFNDVKVLEGGLDQWKKAFPEKIEEGSGTAQTAAPAKQASSGGCGD